MGRCKEIIIKVIPASVANPFVKAHHYSGKVVPNSQLHFGAFLDGKLHGVLSYGCSMDKRKTMALVKDTSWNEFLELNRMAFDDYLPRNSESYCIGKTLRMIKKQAPHIKWIISYADGTQCGDGTIYRASNFVLTGITKNRSIIKLPNNATICISTISSHPDAVEIKQACNNLGIEFKRYTVSDWKSMGGGRNRRLSTSIYLFSRQGEPCKTDGARVTFQRNRQNRCWNVQGRECGTANKTRKTFKGTIGKRMKNAVLV